MGRRAPKRVQIGRRHWPRLGDATMSSIHRTTEPTQESVKRQVYSPIEAYWDAFQEWRKRETLRTELCRLTERELADIGITRGEIDYVASKRGIATSHHSPWVGQNPPGMVT
ncbi:DUF1127 domain-containing protein [Bradyrhizobium liaoningense]|uniref:DUF1127 domain-containing protein n=1 Tax=Bradyrhizobium liaoningense TaxID=43992 RepID=UPI0032AEC6A4